MINQYQPKFNNNYLPKITHAPSEAPLAVAVSIWLVGTCECDFCLQPI